ncbi:hypothetical protein [Vibrio europaeus]|uniref:hypothetical protein n=1 Tax=Vibrio europaeus TaxID=300876 RepID=UPI00148E42BF|nr:hypothetical protein [Vibrio europaeus]MDC5818667.1 hypothetical protein [Vibrio europaeus]MDC5839127.1 hypothetical protein [Vibrio europaeus]MDC5871310.1 hypothetical protein [Vibrio europaeus]NOH21890.1 hypothetical protein [Vibrio europaeus]
MSHENKVMIAMQVIAKEADVAEGKRLFASHAEFMAATHHREGELAMLSYNVANNAEFVNPLAPELVPTGNQIFLMVEIYENERGVAEHWRLGKEEWKDFPVMMEWLAKCDVTILHGSEIVHSLW